ncbi:MAG: DNA-binding protein WhiA [Bifidobacteriaceae bacterium]|nr:DNA-binding protein WhiA [Bifidobacteriaceae bacterium]
MALLDDVKSELTTIKSELPTVQKAQAVAMMRFGGGYCVKENKQPFIRAIFDSSDAAQWLQVLIQDQFNRDAKIIPVTIPTPSGSLSRVCVIVDHNAPALALQSGLLDKRVQYVEGLPIEVVKGKIALAKAAWRGAFLANGRLSNPGKPPFLEIVCPTEKAATDLVEVSSRLGISVTVRMVRSSIRVTMNDADAIERMLILIGAPMSAREWSGKRVDGESRTKTNRLTNFDDANMRRSAKAAAEACEKVRHAFEILENDIPDNLRAAGELRLKHGDASLEELGHLADPPITKDAIAGRIRRLLQLAEKTERARKNA